MRIAVASFGSEGDIRPVLALARGLRHAGHEAYLVASPFFAPRAEEAGVPLRPTGPELSQQELDQRLREVMPGIVGERSPLRQTRRLFAEITHSLSLLLPHALEATRDADLILHSSLDVSAFAAALVHGKPRVSAHFFHGLLPMRDSLADGLDLGRFLNRALSGLFRRLVSLLTDRPFNQLLAAAGLPRRRGVLLESGSSPLLNLLPVSPAFVPTDPLWTGRVVQTGYWFLDVPRFVPDPELAAFLEGGEKPLVVTFGSMAGTDARRLTALLREASERAGCRVLLQAGWAGLGEGVLSPNVRRIGFVPHDWLFPRAAAVIHHGGAGTTAAVLRAGVPQSVVWHLGDQQAWGNLIWRRGLSPSRPVWQGALTVDWLARVMRELRSDARLRGNAVALGARVRAEDGVGQAVAAVEAASRSLPAGAALLLGADGARSGRSGRAPGRCRWRPCP